MLISPTKLLTSPTMRPCALFARRELYLAPVRSPWLFALERVMNYDCGHGIALVARCIRRTPSPHLIESNMSVLRALIPSYPDPLAPRQRVSMPLCLHATRSRSH